MPFPGFDRLRAEALETDPKVLLIVSDAAAGTPMRGYMESGDSTFFARRGYVHAIFNVRGSGKSEGFYQLIEE